MRHLIVGYHGTTIENAERLKTGIFDLSKSSPGGWLGRGLYFWEQDISKARWWNKRNGDGKTSAILQAQIDLTQNIIDFTLSDEVESFQKFISDVHKNPRIFGRLKQEAKGRAYDDAIWLEAYAKALKNVYGYRAIVLRGARAYTKDSVKDLTLKNLSTQRATNAHSRLVTKISLIVALRTSEPIQQTEIVS